MMPVNVTTTQIRYMLPLLLLCYVHHRYTIMWSGIHTANQIHVRFFFFFFFNVVTIGVFRRVIPPQKHRPEAPQIAFLLLAAQNSHQSEYISLSYC